MTARFNSPRSTRSIARFRRHRRPRDAQAAAAPVPARHRRPASRRKAGSSAPRAAELDARGYLAQVESGAAPASSRARRSTTQAWSRFLRPHRLRRTSTPPRTDGWGDLAGTPRPAAEPRPRLLSRHLARPVRPDLPQRSRRPGWSRRRPASCSRSRSATTSPRPSAINDEVGRGLRRRADLPDRSLPRQGDGPEPAWRCASPTRCSSRCGTRRTSTTSRSPSPRRVGVEGRGGYYDTSGALRDMVQNHILQLLCLVAMEPPISLDADAVRDEKLKVLRSLKPIGDGDVADADRARPVPRRRRRRRARCRGYLEELGQARAAPPRPSSPSRPRSRTGAGPACRSTCAPASGCRPASPRSSIQFRPIPHSIFPDAAPANRGQPAGHPPAARRRHAAASDGQGPRPGRHAAAGACR